MDSRGHLYADKELADQLEQRLAAEALPPGKRRSKVRFLGPSTSGAMIQISDPGIARELATMKSRQRRAFYGSRKKGHPEPVSLAKARAAR